MVDAKTIKYGFFLAAGIWLFTVLLKEIPKVVNR